MKKGNWKKRGMAIILAAAVAAGGVQALPAYAEDSGVGGVTEDVGAETGGVTSEPGMDLREATGETETIPQATDTVSTESMPGIVKIHMVTSFQSTNAFIIECDGHFAVVDSGEDSDYPKNPRQGVTIGQGIEEKVIAYMYRLGINEENFDYYIGTHAHSDHIGSADEVIREFEPRTVIAPKYEDEFMDNERVLYDNLYVQERMVEAAQEVGANLLLNTPVDPYEIHLGSARIQIFNGARDIKPKSLYDANEISLGVKVTGSNGRSAFIGGDINDYWGVESRLKDEVGKVDVCTLNHHGGTGSNSYQYMMALNPRIILAPRTTPVVASLEPDVHDPEHSAYGGILELLRNGTQIVAAGDMASDFAVVVCLDEQLTNNIPEDLESSFSDVEMRMEESSRVALKGGRLKEAIREGSWIRMDNRWRYMVQGKFLNQGFADINGVRCYFDTDGYLVTGWILHEDKWYCAHLDGSLAKSKWVESGGKWYYLDANYEMAVSTTVDGGYYVDETGVWVQEGTWIKDGIGWWYRYPNGSWPQDCIALIGGERYSFDARGYMQTGWIKRGESWYYAESSGAFRKSQWLFYRGVWYYLKADGRMAVSEMTPDGYKVDEEGRYMEIQGDKWVKDTVGWWYCYADGSWPSNKFVTIEGKVYYFSEEGYRQSGWIKVGEDWYYAETDGSIVFSKWIPYKGTWYYLLPDGKMMKPYRKNNTQLVESEFTP
ncbi:MBL fold metallo-hydrolase [Suipraeoptans intestinalis]|uniref:MBL fold metallo-hydrolase n=1 Tax=Suipraeoptans intestinalis TaxID=2606628 RepID=UPI002A765E26|nr:MBL fold metallo-hydrolase [Suipraeoptans intestinalis]MDY3122716.1 MBL fold metallo-hydrolase [Suipraeoptans intestinalis]